MIRNIFGKIFFILKSKFLFILFIVCFLFMTLFGYKKIPVVLKKFHGSEHSVENELEADVVNSEAAIICPRPIIEWNCQAMGDVSFGKFYGDNFYSTDNELIIRSMDGSNEEKFPIHISLDENHVESKVIGFLADFNVFVVEMNYMEGVSYSLVNRSNAKRTDIEGLPVVSPDRKRFFTYSSSHGSGYVSDQMAIYIPYGGIFVVEYLESGSEPGSDKFWSPFFPEWIDEKTVRFIKRFYSSNDDLDWVSIWRLTDSGWVSRDFLEDN